MYMYMYIVPPRFEPDMVTLVIVEGSSPQYFFHLSAYPDVTQYIWKKDGSVLTGPDGRVILYPNGIKVIGIARTDSGVYTVETIDGAAKATINVIVYCEYSMTIL